MKNQNNKNGGGNNGKNYCPINNKTEFKKQVLIYLKNSDLTCQDFAFLLSDISAIMQDFNNSQKREYFAKDFHTLRQLLDNFVLENY